MTDAIDPRVREYTDDVLDIADSALTRLGREKVNQLAADLSRQLLPPDHVAVDVATLNRLVDDWGRWLADEGRPLVSDSGDSADILYPTFGDYVIAALSDTSPEAAAECPECGGAGDEHWDDEYGFVRCVHCNGTGKVKNGN